MITEIGRATLFDLVTNKPLAITIESIPPKIPGPGKIKLSAFAHIDGEKKELGFITLYWFRTLEDGTYGSEYFPYPLTEAHKFYSYGGEKTPTNPNKILIESLHSHMGNQYSGIGRSLVQAAIEYSYAKGCDGRIFEEAVRNSPGFYYKLGMRTSSPETDAKIAQKLLESEGLRLTKNLGSHMMYLYSEERSKWKDKIKTSPIFKLGPFIQC